MRAFCVYLISRKLYMDNGKWKYVHLQLVIVTNNYNVNSTASIYEMKFVICVAFKFTIFFYLSSNEKLLHDFQQPK